MKINWSLDALLAALDAYENGPEAMPERAMIAALNAAIEQMVREGKAKEATGSIGEWMWSAQTIPGFAMDEMVPALIIRMEPSDV